MVVVALVVATVVGLVVEESSLGQWCGRRCHRAWGGLALRSGLGREVCLLGKELGTEEVLLYRSS